MRPYSPGERVSWWTPFYVQTTGRRVRIIDCDTLAGARRTAVRRGGAEIWERVGKSVELIECTRRANPNLVPSSSDGDR